MIKQKWGRIINISSLHGRVASPFKVAYISAKHGVLGLTKVVALEQAENGITLQCHLSRLRAYSAGREANCGSGQGERHFGGGRGSEDHACTRRHQAAAGTQRSCFAGEVPVYGRSRRYHRPRRWTLIWAGRRARTRCSKACRYSIFDSGIYRIHAVKWLFPQEKATFDALVMSTSEAKML